MNNSQNWNAVGEQMKSALSDALRTGDFTDLNELVSQTVTDALSEAGKQFADGFRSQQVREKDSAEQKTRQEKAKREQHLQRKKQQEENRRIHIQRQRQAQAQRKVAQQALKQQRGIKPHAISPPNARTTALIPAKFKQVGNVSNVLYQVFGGIGFGISSLIAFFRLFAALAGDTTFLGWIINLLFLAVFLGMIRRGVSQRNRLKRAKRYIQLCGGRMYGQMLSLGMFPEGHLDEKKTCLMLNDSVHQQYLEAEKARILREQQALRDKESQEASAANHTASNAQPGQMDMEQEAELNTMIAEGMECIRKLRELNDQIPGEVISQKLYCLDSLLKDIFDSVREHPQQMHQMHKMMDYYLPTTLKLVEAYEDFDKISMPGPEIVAAKAEIERTMDIINQAFSELLSNLFQNAVLDATTDAQVLQTMLAREGLTGNTEFSRS